MTHLRERILALGMALCLCLSLCAVSASAAGEEAEAPISLTVTVGNKSGSNYPVTYKADTVMAEWLAIAAELNKDDVKMKDLRFTCTLEDKLTAKQLDKTLTTPDRDGCSFSFTSVVYNGKDIFVLDGDNAVKVEGGKITLRYKLNEALLDSEEWKTGTTAAIVSSLRQQMHMEASMDVSASAFAFISEKTFKSTARIDITMENGGAIPALDGITSIFAAYGECSTSNPEYSSGGGGGGGTGGGGGSVTPTKPTIEVTDTTPSTGTASGIPAAGGTTTVVSIYAKPGDEVTITTESDQGSMVGHITVTDGEGNRIPLTYGGEGVYTFDMPEDGSAVVDVTYRVIPADPDETGVSELLNTDDHALYMIGDDLGNFRPNASITRAEVATAFFRLLRNQDVARTMHFDDVKMTDWYTQPVETLASLDILEGVGNGDFEPERAITRAEFAAIASRFTKKHFSGASFTDVDGNAWYADAVSTAAHFGWINGMGDGTFEPDRPITRTEAAAIINRMLLRISDWIDVDAGAGRHFPDVGMDFWGRYEISEATNGHDHTLEEKYFYEDWLAEDWREAVDNDPVNFGQPKF